MLFLLFRLGKDRYALEAARIVEVLPLLELKGLPGAPAGVAGVFSYRGRVVPAVDLALLATGKSSAERFSTRIVVIQPSDASGRRRFIGLIAEEATEMLRLEPGQFRKSELSIQSAPYLGPVAVRDDGPVQLIYEDKLLPEAVQNYVFAEPGLPAA